MPSQRKTTITTTSVSEKPKSNRRRRPRKQRQNGVTQNTQGSQLPRAVATKVATTQENRSPIHGREYLGSIALKGRSRGDVLFSAEFTADMAERLRIQLAPYQMYRMNKICFETVTSAGTDLGGMYTIGFCTDPDDSLIPGGSSELAATNRLSWISQQQQSVTSAAYQSAQLTVHPRSRWLFTSKDEVQEGDDRLRSPGRFVVMVNQPIANENNASLDIYVSYNGMAKGTQAVNDHESLDNQLVTKGYAQIVIPVGELSHPFLTFNDESDAAWLNAQPKGTYIRFPQVYFYQLTIGDSVHDIQAAYAVVTDEYDGVNKAIIHTATGDINAFGILGNDFKYAIAAAGSEFQADTPIEETNFRGGSSGLHKTSLITLADGSIRSRNSWTKLQLIVSNLHKLSLRASNK